MEKIASFTVNHNTLQRGLYTSRVDGDVTTYDIRMKLPNSGIYLNNPAMHTVEHIVATYVRNSRFKDNIIYFGPMGCRTGFYLLTRNVEPCDVIVLVREAFEFLRDFEGEIPGVSAIECGNYLEHDLLDAKREAAEYLPVLDGYTVEKLNY
jgi:S-ribosylhomocysteine lyase